MAATQHDQQRQNEGRSPAKFKKVPKVSHLRAAAQAAGGRSAADRWRPGDHGWPAEVGRRSAWEARVAEHWGSLRRHWRVQRY